VIREARREDIPQLIELWHKFDEFHVTSDPSVFRLPSDEQMKARAEKYISVPFLRDDFLLPRYFTFVSCTGEAHSDSREGSVNGFICGMIRRTPDAALLIPCTVAELHAIYVKKSFRSGVVSAQLLEKALAFAQSLGVVRVSCYIWNFNTAARRFITSHGFSASSTKYEKKLC
jgi:GNAT superfamily N-acetyltransferase